MKPQRKREREEERNRENYKPETTSQKTANKMAVNTYLAIITLSVNGLNAPVEGTSLAVQ